MMMKLRAILTMSVMAVVVAFVSYWMAQQSYHWFPPQAAAEAKVFDDLFALFTGLGTFVFLGVMVPFFYSLIFHRAGKYDESDGPPIEGNTWLEVIWTAVPILLVATLVTVSSDAYARMNIQGPTQLVHLPMPNLMDSAYAAPLEPAEPIEHIDVTAKQWAWIFHYPDQDVTSTELHLPVDRRVRLTLRSEDVLHGFFVPAFRLKQDVVPNHAIDLELQPIREGTYRLRDSMFSGTFFAANQADVVVQPLEEYQQWLATAAAQPLTKAYNPAVAEYYDESGQNKPVRGWKSIQPAPPPMVNYAPKHEPTSPPI